MSDLLFAKVRQTAKIPTKRDEDAGYDLYVDTDKDYIMLPGNSTTLLPTGIAACVDSDYYLQIVDRGSNGSKGLTYTAGVVDSGYRNEIFVAICNTNTYPYIITDLTIDELIEKYGIVDEDRDIIIQYGEKHYQYELLRIFDYETKEPDYENDISIYPMSKAIAQMVVLPVPKMNVKEIIYDELKAIPSERGVGSLGSSGK